MAEIYLAAAVGPEGFEKEVAIKVVRSFLASDDGFMKMFVDEARLASRLNHANVVQIFDFAKHDDSYFIAMEYVRGVSLWDLRRRCRELGVRLPSTLVAELGLHIARGLHYAHSLTERGRLVGLVHRDVTPHNVLISFEGAVKITDFGIAKASGNQSSTAAGMLKGKFAYMSPEQARGEKIDSRTDVFALGIVLWEMLTGGRLFEGDSDVAVLRAVQQSYISPPARLNPDVPADLDAVIMKALERDETKRYQSAQEFERALANFVLRNAKSVEDTNVGMFVSQMFKDELDELKAAEFMEREGTHSTAKEPPAEPSVPSVALAETAIVRREHGKPRASAPTALIEKPQTALLPGTVPPAQLGPLMDADEPSQKRTDQMKEWGQQTVTPNPGPPPAVVLKDSFAREVAEASKQINEEEAERARTTDSVPRTTAPAPDRELPALRKKNPLPWVLVSMIAAGFIASLGYLWVFRQREEVPIVVAPPPVAVAADLGAKLAPQQPAVEPAPETRDALPPEKAPEPEPVAAAEAPPPSVPEKAPEKEKPVAPVEKPRAVAMGVLEVNATPFAALSIDGKVRDTEVIGLRKYKLPPGAHTLKLEHPKRVMTMQVSITANRTTPVVFRALEPQ
ncbi:MAG: serine/threonine protein kinase [Archangiaceae bacterium]|nr:serine/threonine protein kinase [Archangiaceae bacterium]